MPTKYWVSSVPSNWSMPNNWSLSSGGPPGAGPPISTEDAVFDIHNGHCYVDVAININNLNKCNAGSIIFSNTLTHTINGNVIVSFGNIAVNEASVIILGNLALENTGAINVNKYLYINGDVTGASSESFLAGNSIIELVGNFYGDINFGNSTIKWIGDDKQCGIAHFYQLHVNEKMNLTSDYVNVAKLKVTAPINGENTTLILNEILIKNAPIRVKEIRFLGNNDQKFLPTTYESPVQFANYAGQNTNIRFLQGEYTFLDGLKFASFTGATNIQANNTIFNIAKGFTAFSDGYLDISLGFVTINLIGENNYFLTDKSAKGTIVWGTESTQIIIDTTGSHPVTSCTFEKACTVIDDVIGKNGSIQIHANNLTFNSLDIREDCLLVITKQSSNNTINVVKNFNCYGFIPTANSSIIFNIGGDLMIGPVGDVEYETLLGFPANIVFNVGVDMFIDGISETEPCPLICQDGYGLTINLGGAMYADYVAVKNVYVSKEVSGINCIDLGGNENWTFGLSPIINLIPIQSVVFAEDDIDLNIDYYNFGESNIFTFYLQEGTEQPKEIESVLNTYQSGSITVKAKSLEPGTKYIWFVVASIVGQDPITSSSQTFSTSEFSKPKPALQRAVSHDKFPKLANQCQSGGSDDRNLAVLDNLHYWDLVILDSSSVLNVPEYLGENGILRNRNPNIIVLSYFSPDIPVGANIDPGSPVGQYIANIPSHFLLKTTTQEPVNWWFNGTSYNHMTNIALQQARNNLANHIFNTVLNTDKFDGIFYDWVGTDISYLSNINQNNPIDLNGDGVTEDPNYQNAQWTVGFKEFFKTCRSVFQDDNIIVGNAGGWIGPEFVKDINGIMIERFHSTPNILPEKNGWAAQMKAYAYYVRIGQKPNFSFLMANSDNAKDYQFMRFSLCSALMFDGYFCFTNTNGAYWSTRWYDEYSVNIATGEASRDISCKGYLGRPLGPAYNPNNLTELLHIVLFGNTTYAESQPWIRAFKNGIVLVNPTNETKHITLNKQYRKIRGCLDTVFNSGELVSTVTLLSKSGIVLLNN